jgi:superfamily I DNA/RNA helicase
LSQYVRFLIDHRNYGPGEILILSPRRLIGYGIRDALRNRGISVHSFYHEEALEEKEAQCAFTLLTLLADPEDRVALRFWLGLHSQTWQAREYARLREHCNASGLSPRQALDQILAGDIRVNHTTRICAQYRNLIQQIEMVRNMKLSILVDHLFPDDSSWARPLRDLAVRALDTIESHKDLVNELTIQITQPEMPEEGDFVRVMSLHKSKGLVARVTIVTGCIEGLIPTTDSAHTPDEAVANLEEQRRLFYVALTRCRDVLVLSSVRSLPRKVAYRIGAQVQGGWGDCPTIASRFMYELGPQAPAACSGTDWMNRGFA